MARQLSILCIHGVAHGDADALLAPSWTDAISAGIRRWNPDLEVRIDFLRYDDLFDHAPLNALTYGEALAKLMASGIIHGIGDWFAGTRGLEEVPDRIRWTAGMIAQWSSEDDLRERARARLLEAIQAKDYDAVCAHSLGSLIAYDAFARNPQAVAGKVFVSLGSQIGNAFVRDCFAGRIAGLGRARMWYHLFNRDDHVFTSHLRLKAENFAEVSTDFDKPGDAANHDPVFYFNHPNTQERVWQYLSGATVARSIARTFNKFKAAGKRPNRRALLVGINAYPDPANRLEGCVNDVFLMSSLLQECGIDAEDIRVVLDDRATTSNILERMHWLLDDVPPDGERVLFYSGHGAQLPAYNLGGEVDHLDECLVPYDFDWNPVHAIRDKQFVEFYSQLAYDTRFVAIFDCCHSGGMTRDGGPRIRGISPPDDIRHRAMRWNARLEMWQARELPVGNRSLANSAVGEDYLGSNGATHRLCRAVDLRGLENREYDRERKALRHKGPYLPVILEACREEQLSYEYRDGAASYGAFTFSLAKELRQSRGEGRNLSFDALVKRTAARLQSLRYKQDPEVVGPPRILKQAIPWAKV
ncbi:MAG TPA: caspase family protein [Usitatibacter sp.]|nr:caspase family protein [Usitatibacter sp.]